MYNTYLYHHGIKGQKWGVRRYQNPDGTLTAEGKVKKARMDATAQKKEDVKNRRTMSMNDLKNKVERLKMEKQLKDLTEDELYPGRRAAKQMLGQIGQKIITTAAAGAALYGIKAAASGKFDMKEFGSAMFNGGAKKK